MCPICLSIIAADEGELISHLLSGHPRKAIGFSAVLTLAHLALARQPLRLLLVDLAVLAAVVAIVRIDGPRPEQPFGR
jgi:hypothetical protein